MHMFQVAALTGPGSNSTGGPALTLHLACREALLWWGLRDHKQRDGVGWGGTTGPVQDAGSLAVWWGAPGV